MKSADDRRQLTIAALAFLAPLALFFGWFFGGRVFTPGFIVAMLMMILMLAIIFRARHKNSRIIGLGATWLATGCGVALFWALLLNGF